MKPATTVLIAGILRLLESREATVAVVESSVRPGVRQALGRNGFLQAFGVPASVATGAELPFREDRKSDVDGFMDYLKATWLARDFLSLSNQTQGAIAAALSEIYVNAFDHAESPICVVTCGWYDRAGSRAQLAVVDFGIGIVGSVRRYFGGRITGVGALRWAFKPNTTTKPGRVARGNGLYLLEQFIAHYHGWMEIRANDGAVVIGDNGIQFERARVGIRGTLIRVTLPCDAKAFNVDYERDDSPLFQVR